MSYYGLRHAYRARDLGSMVLTPVHLPAGVVHARLSGMGAPFSSQLPASIIPTASVSGQAMLTPAPAVCLDQHENMIPCSDPNCTYGDCGSSTAQVTVGALCLDQNQNQIACADPNCTFGDCVGASWFSKSSIIAGIPDVAIYGGVLLLMASLAGGGYYAGRRR